MKKAAVMGVAGLVAAMSLGIAAPARAQGCSEGVEMPPGSHTVYLQNGQLRINPNGPDEDVDQYGGYAGEQADDAYWCAVGFVPPQIWCVANRAIDIALGPTTYVYQDPETGEIVVDYGLLANDATSCVT